MIGSIPHIVVELTPGRPGLTPVIVAIGGGGWRDLGPGAAIEEAARAAFGDREAVLLHYAAAGGTTIRAIISTRGEEQVGWVRIGVASELDYDAALLHTPVVIAGRHAVAYEKIEWEKPTPLR